MFDLLPFRQTSGFRLQTGTRQDIQLAMQHKPALGVCQLPLNMDMPSGCLLWNDRMLIASTVPTVTRKPRIHGLPPITSGLKVRRVSCFMVWLETLDLRMERAKGIEPSYPAWEAGILPLNYARLIFPRCATSTFLNPDPRFEREMESDVR